MDHSISQGMLSNVIPKIENTKLPVRDFNEKVWKLLSSKIQNSLFAISMKKFGNYYLH